MIDRPARSSLPSITARPSAAEKAHFAWLAERAGMSVSALALVAIRNLLEPKGKAARPAATVSHRVAATDRITIRLRPGDGEAIARRASERCMKPSAYLAGLVRAHVATNPPIAASELAELKHSIVVLGNLSSLLSLTAISPALSTAGLEDLRQNLARTRAAVAGLERRTHDLVRTALISWESRIV